MFLWNANRFQEPLIGNKEEKRRISLLRMTSLMIALKDHIPRSGTYVRLVKERILDRLLIYQWLCWDVADKLSQNHIKLKRIDSCENLEFVQTCSVMQMASCAGQQRV